MMIGQERFETVLDKNNYFIDSYNERNKFLVFRYYAFEAKIFVTILT